MEVDRAVGVVAPASQKRSRNGGSKNGKAANCGDQSEHEMHIWTERERRKKMRNMFSNLHALLPQLPAKADKSTIVDEAVTYIKSLQQTLQTLQKQKLEKLRSATLMADSSSIITSHQGTGGASTDQFSEALSVEETFKLAAGEMNLWLLSSSSS
ncbi:hypothetical protein COLO4_26545 [Corchorus olitorius]|uniref:BHLH domain-containing protein n=1 Tax=Corchorus olitorius TaxID=93759 RepID=A0A1R3HWD8_9ROSI|nr:hypothetical protein COLO4_26545 [Corchorus olitorius]